MLLADLKAGLHDAERLEPSFCAVCALSVPADFPDDSAAFVEFQSQNDDFWDLCMRSLVVKRTPDQEDDFRARLQAKIDTCEHRRHAHDALLAQWRLGHIVDAPVLFRALLCTCLTGCLYCANPLRGNGHPAVLDRAKDPRKRFRSSAGSWPTTPDQLFPYGEAQTVSALVYGCLSDEDDGYWWIINAVVHLARPRALPILFSNEELNTVLGYASLLVISYGTRTRISFRSLDGASTVSSLSSEGPHRDRYWLSSGRGLKIVAAFLLTIREGPYMHPDDIYRFLLPCMHTYREAYAFAYRQSLAAPDNVDWESISYCLLPASAHMHEARQLIPDSDVLAAVQREPRGQFVIMVIQLALIALFSEKHCSGPGCTRTALDEETDRPPLPTCARCKLARYCSRACQRADWADGHKRLCPVLAALEAVAPAGACDRAYCKTIKNSHIPDSDLAEVGLWAVCSSQHYRDIIRMDIVYPFLMSKTRRMGGFASVTPDPEPLTRFLNLYK